MNTSISEKAVALVQAADEVKAAKAVLDRAYRSWKFENTDDFVPKGSEDWESMMDATQVEYAEVKKAKRKAYNAMRRLTNAVKAA